MDPGVLLLGRPRVLSHLVLEGSRDAGGRIDVADLAGPVGVRRGAGRLRPDVGARNHTDQCVLAGAAVRQLADLLGQPGADVHLTVGVRLGSPGRRRPAGGVPGRAVLLGRRALGDREAALGLDLRGVLLGFEQPVADRTHHHDAQHQHHREREHQCGGHHAELNGPAVQPGQPQERPGHPALDHPQK